MKKLESFKPGRAASSGLNDTVQAAGSRPTGFTLLAACFFLLTSCSKPLYVFTSFHEPATEGLRLLTSKDGLHWDTCNTVFLKPEIGDKVMRDPSIVKDPDGTFHLVWTLAWKGNKGFGYSSSKDLIHWTPEQQIDVMKNEPTTVNVWAPELFYDDVKDEFIIIWASTIPKRFPRGIEDEDNNHRMYYTTTKDFKTFSETKLFLDPGFSVIDCVILKRGNKDYVLILKDNTRPNRNIKVAFAANPLGPYSSPSEAFTPNFTEGPSIAKVVNEYVVYYDQYREKIFGAMKTSDFKTFTDYTGKVRVPEGHKHGTIFMADKKIVKKLCVAH